MRARPPTLEDQYGEANDGPEVEDDPRLDTEVTDETTDLAMGLDDTEDDGATSLEMSEAEGDEGPEADVELSEDVAAALADDPAGATDDEPVSAEVAEVEVDDLEADEDTETDAADEAADEADDDDDESRRGRRVRARPTRSRSSAPSSGPSPVTGSSCTPTPAWRTG